MGGLGWWVGLGVIIESNLNRVRLSCCWVGVGLGCDNFLLIPIFNFFEVYAADYFPDGEHKLQLHITTRPPAGVGLTQSFAYFQ